MLYWQQLGYLIWEVCSTNASDRIGSQKDNTPGCTSQAYDVWKEKNMYGKKTMSVVRTTYLINEEGVITKAFDKVKAAKNPEEMLELL